MDDLISRQDVLDEILRSSSYFDKDMIIRLYIGINRLPSAQPDLCLNTENCGASQTVFPTAEEAVKAWNKRSRAKKGES